MINKRYKHVGALIIGVIIVQLFTHFSDKSYYLTQLTMSGYYILVIMGLCLLMGYAGQISLGHAGFFAMGGYISSVMNTYDLAPHSDSAFIGILSSVGLVIERAGLYGGTILYFQPWFACIVAVLFTILVAYLIGGPVLKLKGHYLAMATLGFGIIIYSIVLGTEIFGSADGISGVQGFTLLSGLEVTGSRASRVSNYYIAWGLVAMGMLMLLNLIDSRVGRSLRAIHAAENAANSMGVDTASYKLKMFVLSAAFASIAGVFMSHYSGGIGPSEAGVMKSVRYVAIVAVGGMANLWGAVIMGLVLNFLSLRGYFGSMDDAVFGVILITIMLFAPDGIFRASVLTNIKSLFTKRSCDEAKEA